MESKKPFWEYTLPPGVNIGRVNGVTLLSDRKGICDFLACKVQAYILEMLLDVSSPLDNVPMMTNEVLAHCWLTAAKEVAHIDWWTDNPGVTEWRGGTTLFAPLVGSVFDCEPTTVKTKPSALKVIQRLRAMRGQTRCYVGQNDAIVMGLSLQLLGKKEFTQDHKDWAESIMANCSCSWARIGAIVDNIVEAIGRKHLRATTQRATKRASRNKERDDSIRAEFKALRTSGSTSEDAWTTLAENNDLTIERIKQILRAGLPKNL